MQTPDVVVLVPGFLGFTRFGGFYYFADRLLAVLRGLLEEPLEARRGVRHHQRRPAGSLGGGWPQPTRRLVRPKSRAFFLWPMRPISQRCEEKRRWTSRPMPEGWMERRRSRSQRRWRGVRQNHSDCPRAVYGRLTNRSLKSVAFAAPPSSGLTPKISSTVRSVELCV